MPFFGSGRLYGDGALYGSGEPDAIIVVDGVHASEGPWVARDELSSRSALFYWASIYGARPVKGGRDVDFSRATRDATEDRVGRWVTVVPRLLTIAWETLRGVLVPTASTQESRTQKAVRNVDFGTNALDGWTLSAGDSKASLSLADKTDLLRESGLIAQVPDGRVLLLDNSKGTTTAAITNDGTCGNTNAHVISAFVAGGGRARPTLTGQTPAWSQLARTFERIWRKLTPGAGTDNLVIEAEAGARVYVVLAGLEEGSWPGRPMRNPDDSSFTRSADVYSVGPPPDPRPAPAWYWSGFLAMDLSDVASDFTFFSVSPSTPGSSARLAVRYVQSAQEIQAEWWQDDGTSGAEAGVSVTPADWEQADFVEILAWLEPDGSLQVVVTRELGSASQASDATPSAALPEGWDSDARVYFGGHGEEDQGAVHHFQLKAVVAADLDSSLISGSSWDDLLHQVRRFTLGATGEVTRT